MQLDAVRWRRRAKKGKARTSELNPKGRSEKERGCTAPKEKNEGVLEEAKPKKMCAARKDEERAFGIRRVAERVRPKNGYEKRGDASVGNVP